MLPDSDEEEEEDCYNSDEGHYFKAQPLRDVHFSSSMTGPTPSSIVKLEANQKARNKRERQELYGRGAALWPQTGSDRSCRAWGAMWLRR